MVGDAFHCTSPRDYLNLIQLVVEKFEESEKADDHAICLF